ncbi:MAG: hypothetical protein K6T65_16815, partial [Peptococcaceae bacterium]|nr:hypothetical protein [Peptococcaceae bacterium]
MKKREIVIGGIYSNGKKGRFYSERKVVDISMEGKYKLYKGQINQETVFYETIKGYYSNRCSK